MAFQDNPVDGQLNEGWLTFCERIKDASEYIYKDASGATECERTNAFRYLTQNLSQAFDIFLENRDTLNPTIHAFCGPTRKLGCDNADCIYLQSWINDTDTYKISGHIGTAKMFNIALQGEWAGLLHEPFGDVPIANLLGHQIERDWNGNFTVWVSPEPQTGNWMQSKPGTRKIFYRQYFDHWDEVPATYRIERVGSAEAPPAGLPSRDLLAAFEDAARFVVNTTKEWPDYHWGREGTHGVFNQFKRYGAAIPSDQDVESIDARRGRVVACLNWCVDPDQALILDFVPNPEWFWQITACTVFGASLEYRYRQVSLTSGMSPLDQDGHVRVVVAHDDPGVANWIDVQAHSRGWLYFRNMFTREVPEVRTKLVPAAALHDELGSVAATITPQDRSHELRKRREANQRRFVTS
jgi:hypothetical protein